MCAADENACMTVMPACHCMHTEPLLSLWFLTSNSKPGSCDRCLGRLLLPEGAKANFADCLPVCMQVWCLSIHTYIYIYICVCVYIYIYRYTHIYSQSGKVGRWFTEIGAWRKTSSNFKFGRLCFMSSKFHVFQLWCTKCSRAGTAAFRNTPNIVCSKHWRDSETVGGTADELSPKYRQFQDPP